MQACKLDLAPPPNAHLRHHPSSPSLAVSSLLFDPSSRSLALMRSDASVLLYPSLPFPTPPQSPSLPPPPPPPPPTVVPPISTSGCFLRLLPSPSSVHARVVFLSSAPHAAGAATLLRAWILEGDAFVPARLSFRKDRDEKAVVLDVRHGFAVRLAGSVNVFVLHSPAEAKIWVLAAKISGDGGEREGVGVEFMKCAVINCVVPVYSIRVSSGLLLLGEVGGVRVFPLRPLVKGRVEGRRAVGQKKAYAKAGSSSKGHSVRDVQMKLPNGLVPEAVGGGSKLQLAAYKCNGETTGLERAADASSESTGSGVANKERIPTKLKTLILKQNSGDHGSFFVKIKFADVQRPENKTRVVPSLKAVAIHSLSQWKFLILDSFGDLYLLDIHNNVLASDRNAHASVTSIDAPMRRLDCAMKVQMLAVLPDLSLRSQIVWISDGCHSLHVMSLADVEITFDEKNMDECKEKLVHMSASQAIFTSEKIKDIVPLTASAVLILGQGNIFGYATV